MPPKKQKPGIQQLLLEALGTESPLSIDLSIPEKLQFNAPVSRTVKGLIRPGNIDNKFNRKILVNPPGYEGGGISTASSVSSNFGAGEVLYPTVVDGKRLTEQEAKRRYLKTGLNFGTFDSPASATAYARTLSKEMDRIQNSNPNRRR
jgi:hypothetical protein